MKETYHFIGVGGIGMSALAHILLEMGHLVTGSDVAKKPLMDVLVKKGADLWFSHDEENISSGTVVYSSAINQENSEFKRAKELNLKLLHRSDLLNDLMQDKKVLQVTGTHGKTTTSSLLSHTLLALNIDPSFALGGHLLPQGINGKKGEGAYFVAEADESDGSFLKTPSYGAIVTNCGKDHLSYWETPEKLRQGFQTFFSQAKKHLFWCKDDPTLNSLNPSGMSYGFSPEADLSITHFKQTSKGIEFDLGEYKKIFVPLYGRHNALNAAGVFGLCLSLGMDPHKIIQAFSSFGGVGRRLELKAEKHGVRWFDDYGHHPTEIKATLDALRDLAVERRVVVLFEPHRYTRVSDFWEEFGSCFEKADLVLVTDIYEAGESPIEGVTAYALAEKIGKKAIHIPKIEEAANYLRPFDVFFTTGAGNVTSLGEQMLQKYEEKKFRYELGILCGGTSPEHEVSLLSTRNILNNLDERFYNPKLFYVSKEGNWSEVESLDHLIEKREKTITPEVITSLLSCDTVMPVFHGPQGEDGMIQGFLETLGLCHVGCDYRACSFCMNKARTKQAAMEAHIPVVPYIEMSKREYQENPHFLLEKMLCKLSFPVWVKPVHLGSSIGITRAANVEEFNRSVELAFSMDEAILVEKEMKGQEIEFALLGNKKVRIAEPSSILTGGGFYDYERKYGSAHFRAQIPAPITDIQKQVGIDLAKKVYTALGCIGLARIDFFLDESGVFWLNEVNPFPGFTQSSVYPKMWEHGGLSCSDLINELISLSLQKKNHDTKNS